LFYSAFDSSIDTMWQVDGSVWVNESSANADEELLYSNASVFAELFGTGSDQYAYGLYKGDNGTLGMMGVFDGENNGDTAARIYGMSYIKNYDYTVDVAHPQFATLLVANDIELPDAPTEYQSVPVTASFSLMLFGLAGMRKRK